MARFRSVLGLLRALAVLSWRDLRSFRSIGGQNFSLFLAFVALQPESAEFLLVLLALILLFPLSTDPMAKLPPERRATWPLARWEWLLIRAGSFLMNPIVWIALPFLLRGGWRFSALFLAGGLFVQLAKHLIRSAPGTLSASWLKVIPAPRGMLGAIMRLHWRAMLQTLDPYVALALVICTEMYRAAGGELDPAAPKILALVTVLLLSTGTQSLLGMDGAGAQRYRQLPIRGWQILFAKDLAFLVVVALLVAPLSWAAGLAGGVAVLAIGHHRSVLHPVQQARWRFTEGAIVPDGIVQIVALFAVGNAVGEQ